MASSAFGARLLELRERAGLTQKQLGERAGMAQATIANLEQGRNQPSLATAAALARALGITTDAFLQGPAPKAKRERGRPRKDAQSKGPEKKGRKKKG